MAGKETSVVTDARFAFVNNTELKKIRVIKSFSVPAINRRRWLP